MSVSTEAGKHTSEQDHQSINQCINQSIHPSISHLSSIIPLSHLALLHGLQIYVRQVRLAAGRYNQLERTAFALYKLYGLNGLGQV